jgi:tRNA C32,U32 (ribose-2'-O)-methylase TrmJ
MKKKMKVTMITSLILILGLMMNLNVQAQQHQQKGKQGPPPIPDQEQISKMVNELSKTLALDEDQKKDVEKKFNKHFEEVRAKKEESRPKREEMEALRTDFEEEVKSILDDKQKKQFDAFMKEKEKERGNKKPEHKRK